MNEKSSGNRPKHCRFLWMVVLVFFLSCSTQEIADPGTTEVFRIAQQAASLTNANCDKIDMLFDFETLFVNASELERNKQFCVELAEAGEISVLRRAVVTTDSDGEILHLPMLFDSGFDPVNNNPLLPGDYEVRIQGHDRKPFDRVVLSFEIMDGFNPDTPTILPSDPNGGYTCTVTPGGDLFATGGGFPPSTEVRIFVVDDQDEYNDGDPLNDVSGGFETVTTDAGGNLPITLVWDGIAGGCFDLIGDLPPLGQYNEDDALREAKLPGVCVQNLASASDIITQLACDANGIFQDMFDEDDLIFVRSEPGQMPMDISADATVYIVVHQDQWTDDDPLVNVVDESSHEMPNHECIRPECGVKAKFPIVNEPELPPGRYDVIIDVGRNFVYNSGTDILDGGTQIGFTIPGDIPEIRTFVSTDNDFLPFEDPKTTIYVKVVDDNDTPVAGATVTFKIDKGPGVLTTSNEVTDGKGVASTDYSDGVTGEFAVVEVTVKANGSTFKEKISIWTKISLHDQGSFGGGGN